MSRPTYEQLAAEWARRDAARRIDPPPMVRIRDTGMEWMDAAACRGADLNRFFPLNPSDQRAARTYCDGCPVRWECLDHAVRRPEKYGVWGGETEEQRRGTRRRALRREARRAA